MDYRQLGRTGLTVSPLGLGTVNFSWLTDEADSFRIMDHALEQGVNLFDTSNNYNAGKTEELIGRWLAQGGGRREQVVLSTKVYSKPNDWGSPDAALRDGSWVGPNDHGLSARHIRAAVDASLRRLQTDHIDIYQMHHVDRRVGWDEIWQAMDVLVAQGKVLYVGSSNFAGWHIAQASETARSRHSLGLACEQSVYNLMNRTIELEVIPACRDYGLGILTYSPLAGGMLAGATADDGKGRRAVLGLEATASAERYASLCTELGHSPADVALAWVAQRPGVTAPIVGPRTLEQFQASLRAVSLQLDEQALSRLDEIFPGPGGPAPEAYAW
jgi:aryl-alcohol dehydrogenase-like predicted oxidoreductase